MHLPTPPTGGKDSPTLSNGYDLPQVRNDDDDDGAGADVFEGGGLEQGKNDKNQRGWRMVIRNFTPSYVPLQSIHRFY